MTAPEFTESARPAQHASGDGSRIGAHRRERPHVMAALACAVRQRNNARELVDAYPSHLNQLSLVAACATLADCYRAAASYYHPGSGPCCAMTDAADYLDAVAHASPLYALLVDEHIDQTQQRVTLSVVGGAS